MAGKGASAFVRPRQAPQRSAPPGHRTRGSTPPVLLSTCGLDGLTQRLRAHGENGQGGEKAANHFTDKQGHFHPHLADPEEERDQSGVPALHQRYAVLRFVGSGTCSRVFAARDMFRPDRPDVAIKVVHAGFGEVGIAEDALLQLLQDGRHARSFHVVRRFDSFWFPCRPSAAASTNAHFCIVLELLRPIPSSLAPLASPCPDGLTLGALSQEWVPKQETSPPPSAPPTGPVQVASMLQQLLVAVLAVHSAGFVHTDLKPDNVMQTADGQVKLIDLSNVLQSHQQGTCESDFDVQTPSYRAPEVVLGVALTPAMDVWSLGCVALEWLTGQRLFSCKGMRHLLHLVVQLVGNVPARYAQGKLYSQYFSQDHTLFGAGESGGLGPASRAARQRNICFLLSSLDCTEAARNLELTDLLARMLDPDHLTRIAISQALSHPYFHCTSPLFAMLRMVALSSAASSALKVEGAAPRASPKRSRGGSTRVRTHTHARARAHTHTHTQGRDVPLPDAPPRASKRLRPSSPGPSRPLQPQGPINRGAGARPSQHAHGVAVVAVKVEGDKSEQGDSVGRGEAGKEREPKSRVSKEVNAGADGRGESGAAEPRAKLEEPAVPIAQPTVPGYPQARQGARSSEGSESKRIVRHEVVGSPVHRDLAGVAADVSTALMILLARRQAAASVKPRPLKEEQLPEESDGEDEDVVLL